MNWQKGAAHFKRKATEKRNVLIGEGEIDHFMTLIIRVEVQLRKKKGEKSSVAVTNKYRILAFLAFARGLVAHKPVYFWSRSTSHPWELKKKNNTEAVRSTAPVKAVL